MAPTTCSMCHSARAVILRPKNRQAVCKACFIEAFESEIHSTITANRLFQPGETVAIGASGGKDSTVLASVLCTLNERHGYGLQLSLLSVDEGITGYRDDSLESVKRNAADFGLPLTIVGYKELYGWTMDEVVRQTGKKGNCTYCGVFRRQALDRGAERLGVKHVVTGHNADDIAETVMMNLLRGDLPRLSRATSIVTASASSPIKRSKPLKYAYEKEIVLYAHHKKLDYFSTECIYSPEAFRGSARALIKNLERIRPSAILDVVRSGEDMARYVLTAVTDGGHACAGREAKMAITAAGKGHRKVENGGAETVQQDVDENGGGCGSANGRAGGGEMADMERRLRENERAEEAEREVEVTRKTLIPHGQRHDRNQQRDKSASNGRASMGKAGNGTDSIVIQAEATHNRTPKKLPRPQMGQCQRCGYMSSQATCKACTLLEGLNRNRPRTEIEVSIEDEESGSTLMRTMESVALAGGPG